MSGLNRYCGCGRVEGLTFEDVSETGRLAKWNVRIKTGRGDGKGEAVVPCRYWHKKTNAYVRHLKDGATINFEAEMEGEGGGVWANVGIFWVIKGGEYLGNEEFFEFLKKSRAKSPEKTEECL